MKHILLVEDDPACLLLLKKVVQKSGYQPDLAKDGLSALRLTQQKNYDVVLSDLMMPGIDGIELVRRIRQKHPSIPPYVALITAFDLDSYRSQAEKVGVNIFISKAAGSKSFPQQIKDLLSQIQLDMSEQHA